MLRLVVGPFPVYVVVLYHYAMRINTVSLLWMLTFNRIITSAFILNFPRMSAVPEKQVMRCLGMFTIIFTLGSIIHEVLERENNELDHFGRLNIFPFLGKVQIKYNIIYPWLTTISIKYPLILARILAVRNLTSPIL